MVLITGETGSGKRTDRQGDPLPLRHLPQIIPASFLSDLMESELFGYEKGAFSG